MEKERNLAIDFLKGFAMVLIILIHVTVYFRDNMLAKTLWEYSQVAVPIFVFCSAYLYFSRTKEEHFSISYFWKRAKRLIVPYYAFLIIFTLYSTFFKNIPLSFETIARKAFFLNSSSRDLDWLVVLFLYFTILMPFIRILSKKPILLGMYALISFISSVWFLFYHTESAFRLVMWLPWSLVLIITSSVVQYEKKKGFLFIIAAGFFVLYMLSRAVLLFNEGTVVLTENKYPPNIFYLSYGIFFMLLLYQGYKYLAFKNFYLQNGFGYLSKHSYSIFFIHFLILYFFLDFTNYKKFQWWGLFSTVFSLSIITQVAINNLGYFLSTLKKAKPL